MRKPPNAVRQTADAQSESRLDGGARNQHRTSFCVSGAAR
jgi:hypothetical protein